MNNVTRSFIRAFWTYTPTFERFIILLVPILIIVGIVLALTGCEQQEYTWVGGSPTRICTFDPNRARGGTCIDNNKVLTCATDYKLHKVICLQPTYQCTNIVNVETGVK